MGSLVEPGLTTPGLLEDGILELKSAFAVYVGQV